MRAIRAAAAAAALATAAGHICLLSPVQRGGYNVSDPGDNSCFQPTGPCGDTTPGAPVADFVAGQGEHAARPRCKPTWA